MDKLKNGWFSEINEMWPGVALSLEVDDVLYKCKSNYQDIMVLQTRSHGKALILDNIIQCTEYDEYSYQEMISYIPLCSHPKPEKVLIVGGGDGGVAREVCKFPSVSEVNLVEIDDKVMHAAKKYLPGLGRGLTHPKLTVHVQDGFKFLADRKGEYDVIITDSSDPVGPAVSLFKKDYYELMRDALRPGGLICCQVGTYWENMDVVKNTFQICQQVFPTSGFAYTCVPTYPTGQICFVLGSTNKATNFREPVKKLSEEDLESMKMKYYTTELHRAAFVLPRFAQQAIEAK